MSIEPGPLTGEHALLEGATLAADEPIAAAAQRDAERFVAVLREVLQQSLSRLAAVEPDLRKSLVEAAELEDELRDSFRRRCGVDLRSQPYHASGSAAAATIDDWSDEASDALEAMLRTRVPLFQGKRFSDQARWAAQFGRLIADRPVAVQRTLQAGYETLASTGVRSAAEHFAAQVVALRAQLDTNTAPLPVIGWLGQGAMDHEPVPGPGRLLLHVGFAVLSPLQVILQKPGIAAAFAEPQFHTVETGPFALPMLLDLDRDGGLVTDRVEPVNNTVLRLLALLPAGQIKLTVFDPARLGESVDFLYEMGDAAEAVIGSKVRTTDRDLAEALLELEEHITFVTQKYLQGTYDSLTDYNLAAGDVAEPYRVLVLYDYPSGFSRPGGGVDDESLARLRKIVEVGRRCGVFTLVVTRADLGDPFRNPLVDLPWLWAGQTPAPDWVAKLVVGDAQSSGLTLSFPGPGATDKTQAEVATEGRRSPFLGPAEARWRYAPDEMADPSTVKAILAQAERGVALSGDVRVSLDQIGALARRELERAVSLGTRNAETLPAPGDPSTWWGGDSAEEIVAAFGRVGARDVGSLKLDGRTASGALIGGRPGSGKSILLHAIVASLVQRYGPDELQLYLVDFKEGVEFKAYATGGLPHARVVAIESEREFGLSVLKSLDEQIGERGAAFREGAGEEVNLAAYRARTGRSMPRIVLIVDEFHVLFDRDDKIAAEAAELLDRIIRQGRAFGVHCVLASQTIAGTAGLGRHTLDLLPIRIALQCSDADSRLLLADDNADARLLTRPGEGIFNAASGVREANKRFQAAYTTSEERAEFITALRRLADERGFASRPVVFEGNDAVQIDALAVDDVRAQLETGKPRLPLGLPLTLAGPVVAELRREPGGNLLVIAEQEAAWAVLTIAIAALRTAKVEVDLLDFGPLDASWLGPLAALGVEPARRRDAEARLEELVRLTRERLDLHDHQAPSRVCVVSALHRAREFDATAIEPASELLEELLRDGPDVGIHVIAWCDKPVSLSRRLSSSALREFGFRFLGPMSRDDSFSLVDSDLAAAISPAQAVFDDHDRAATTRLRRFALPGEGWAARLPRR